jgi:site-specific DNA-cytosine methylase
MKLLTKVHIKHTKRLHPDWTCTDGYSVRRLTPLECERLQGFPDGWTEGHADSHRYRMLGNAVAVPVVEWILRRIQEAGL